MKTYTLINDFYLSTTVNVGGKVRVVEFSGGSRASGIRGFFATDNLELQKAIESDSGYGKVFTCPQATEQKQPQIPAGTGAPGKNATQKGAGNQSPNGGDTSIGTGSNTGPSGNPNGGGTDTNVGPSAGGNAGSAAGSDAGDGLLDTGAGGDPSVGTVGSTGAGNDNPVGADPGASTSGGDNTGTGTTMTPAASTGMSDGMSGPGPSPSPDTTAGAGAVASAATPALEDRITQNPCYEFLPDKENATYETTVTSRNTAIAWLQANRNAVFEGKNVAEIKREAAERYNVLFVKWE